MFVVGGGGWFSVEVVAAVFSFFPIASRYDFGFDVCSTTGVTGGVIFLVDDLFNSSFSYFLP
jgi:hypothetical protein